MLFELYIALNSFSKIETTLPLSTQRNMTSIYYKDHGDIFLDYIHSIDIKGYCRGCSGERGRYDCSSFISNFLMKYGVLSRRINSYVMYNYGHKIDLDDAVRGDILVMMNKGTGYNHLGVFWDYDEKGFWIYDLYEEKTKWTARNIGKSSKKYKYAIIGNPIKYGFKDIFQKKFPRHIGKKYGYTFH